MSRKHETNNVVTKPFEVPAVIRADLVVLLALAVTGLVVFSTGLNAWFTSDAWQFLEVAFDLGLTGVWVQFVPHPENWFRPLTRLVFQIEFALFGFQPLGYHLVALALHVATAWLVYLLARQLTQRRAAAVLAAFTFLLTIHAHEIVWDIGDLHNALGGVPLVAAVVLYARGRRLAAWIAMAVSLMSDETGLLTFGLLIWYDILFYMQGWNVIQLRGAVRRLVPFAALIGVYVAMRWTIGGGTFLNEQQPCHAPLCLVNGMGEYFNRFFVRSEWLLGFVWSYRPLFAVVLMAGVVVLMVWLKPWRWHKARALAFAAGWMGLSSFFFVWALWPYVADRFWYVPDAGLALLVGVVASHALDEFTRGRWARVAVTSGALVLGMWVAVGVVMLVQRGKLWTRAGAEAQMIVQRVQELVPNPPLHTTFVMDQLPDSYYVTFAPGNTGPYLFRNGIREALRLRYNRADVRVVRGWDSPDAGTATAPIYLRVSPGQVERITP